LRCRRHPGADKGQEQGESDSQDTRNLFTDHCFPPLMWGCCPIGQPVSAGPGSQRNSIFTVRPSSRGLDRRPRTKQMFPVSKQMFPVSSSAKDDQTLPSHEPSPATGNLHSLVCTHVKNYHHILYGWWR
jgi:hypothetical protein